MSDNKCVDCRLVRWNLKVRKESHMNEKSNNRRPNDSEIFLRKEYLTFSKVYRFIVTGDRTNYEEWLFILWSLIMNNGLIERKKTPVTNNGIKYVARARIKPE